MILSVDPPRHALLVHFGPRKQPVWPELVRPEARGSRIELALNPNTHPPTLVALHFIRHGFRLPFVGRPDQFSTADFRIEFRRTHRFCRFLLTFRSDEHYEWNLCPGLTVLLSEPLPEDDMGVVPAAQRPDLVGFVVDTNILRIDIDMDDFHFEFGTDLLKDVSADLFVEK